MLQSPTGIPRVVQQYLKFAPEAARRVGVDLVPVEIAQPGRFQLFRFPGTSSGESRHTSRRPKTPASTMAVKVLIQAMRYLCPVLRQIFLLVGAVLPFHKVEKVTSRWARSMDKLIPKVKRYFDLMPTIREPVEIRRGDIMFVPGCWYNMDIDDYQAARAQGAEIVFLMHDVMPVTLPQIHEYPWRWEFRERLIKALAVVDHYYAISWQTLNDVKAFAQTRDVTIRGAVAYNGFNPSVGVADAASLSPEGQAVMAQRPWLMVGSVEPKKGHGDAVAALETLWDAGYERPLVIIGRPGWHVEETAAPIRESRWLGKRLFWADTVDDAALEAYYVGGHGFISASVAEGFGLPVLEAAARGLPVVVRDLSVFREVLGDSGIYFTDVPNLAAAVAALEDPEHLAAARAAIADLTWYDWPAVINAVIADLLRPDRSVDRIVPEPETRRPVFSAPAANDTEAKTHAIRGGAIEIHPKVALLGAL